MGKFNKIIPLQPNRVWRTYTGGRELDKLERKANPEDTHFPEDWIASLTPAVNPGREEFTEEGLSVVHWEGKQTLLKSLIEKYPEELLGKTHCQKHGTTTAFLLKLLDSAIRLHIQCHPTVDFAKQFLNSDNGKTEGYYILRTRNDVKEPFIYLGFQNPPSKEDFKKAIEQQDIEFMKSCFEKIPAKKGDAFIVPGGLPHAIGEGVFMVEIMEPTDLAVRIEFEKAGYVLPEKARFMDRRIDFALSMFNYEALSVKAIREKYFINPELIRSGDDFEEFSVFDDRNTDKFRMNKLVVNGSASYKNPGTFYVAIVTGGEGIVDDGSQLHRIRFGDKFFVSASCGEIKLFSTGGMELIIAEPPV